MTSYEILLWLHVTGAVLWVGGGVMVTMLAEMARRTKDDVELAYLMRRIGVVGPKFLAPLSGITGLLGVLLVLTQDAFSFSDAWVGPALALWIASAVTGAAYLSPRAEKIGEATSKSGRVTDDVRPLVEQVLRVARIDSVVLLVIVFLMTVKPGA